MSLIELYKENCNNYDFLTQYSETGIGKYGKIFVFQNTNYRRLLSFITNYTTFKNGADGVDRSSWELNTKHGQENLKQHVVNMIKSRFFSKNERTYYKTRKGEVLDNIPENFSEEEKWIITYLLLIDGYFDNIPNYILKKSEEMLENYLVYINDETKINSLLIDFISKSKTHNIESLFEHDYIYLDTFYKPFRGIDFLAIYLNSSKEEKMKLFQYITSNYKKQKQLINESKSTNDEISSNAKNLLINFKEDCISKKYKSGGNFTKSMVVDNAKILFISNYINKEIFFDFSSFIKGVVNKYSKIESIDSGKIFQFIFNLNKDIFEICYFNIFNPNYFDNISVSENNFNDSDEFILNKLQETSVIESIEEITKISSILKRKALERAFYKCELEEYCNCSAHYFTNKKTGKNYVELHHLIPREFSNDFEKSIEQIENYVSLCPRCHRFVHFAVDRERRNVLHYLYNKRIGSLNLKGIKITEQELKNYYRIEE